MRKRGIKSKRPEATKFFEIYNNDNYTVEEIARLYGVSKHTIYKWASQLKNEKLSDKQIYIRQNYNKNNTKKKERMKA